MPCSRHCTAISTRGASPADDADWNELTTLEIGPHPDLSESKKRIIALDYGMRGGRAQIQVRKALRYYALRRLGLDTPPEATTGRSVTVWIHGDANDTNAPQYRFESV